MSCNAPLVSIHNCKICNGEKTFVEPFSWELKAGEFWLVTGPNGGGKAHFIQALGTNESTFHVDKFEPVGNGGLYSDVFGKSRFVVSLEVAAALIQQERDNDEGDYIEGGVDIGRTVADFIFEVLHDSSVDLELLPEVKLCGVASVLNRGLKYLSTGEIRRVLLCRALLSKSRLLILSDPFAGLDAESRKILRDFFSVMATKAAFDSNSPAIILCMERFTELPDGINRVLEFSDGKMSFCGCPTEYSQLLEDRLSNKNISSAEEKEAVAKTINQFHTERRLITESSTLEKANSQKKALVDMENVTVAWGDNVVLDNLTWHLYAGEHWLIRGPNGSGKTTFLELITGDNMQVYCNNVSIFGRRRGTGETVWELKEKMGIVSYRLHLEYRMLGGTDLEGVMLSGFHDSIGLYQQRSQVEQGIVSKWLEFGGFAGRGGESFSSLSYGEQRALLILRALVKHPPLLILDEPCHGLDEVHRNRILNLLEAIAKTGTTTLLHVTHDPTEVLPCEKQILELCPGEKPMYKIIYLGQGNEL